MDIFCPFCQNHLTIDDNHAGQYLKCPICSGMFTAPALPSAVIASAPAAPSPPPPPARTPEPIETFQLEPLPHEKAAAAAPPVTAPVLTPPATGNGSAPALAPALAPTPAPTPPAAGQSFIPPLPQAKDAATEVEPPLPVGEYTRAFIVHFNPNYVRWFGPVGLGLTFVLSFFSWRVGGEAGSSPWSIAFSRDAAMGVFLPYVFLLLIALVLSVVSVLLTRRLIVLPEPFKKLRSWRSLVVAAVVFVGFLILFFNWIHYNFNPAINPTTIWYKLALRLHGFALVGLLLEFWLDRRHKKNLPLPKIELRW